MEPPTPSRLNNEDFRKLLATPRAQEPATPSRFAKYDPNFKPDFKKPEMPAPSEKAKKKKPYVPKKVEEKQEGSGYIDLAKLRRDNALPDHEVEEEGTINYVNPEEAKDMTESERRSLEIERSKYFGGSEKSTHLVKGLDYALLAKVKEDIATKERETEAQQNKEKVAKEGDKASNYSKVISTEGQAHEIEAPTDFKTFIGKAIYDVISSKPPEVMETFLPGRTSFVFDLDPDSMTDIPTIVKRSKDDLPVGRDLMSAVTHPDLMHKLTKIMVYYHQGAKAYKKLKKKEKKEKEERVNPALGSSSQSQAPIAEIDSIFDDADMSGVHIPIVSKLPLADDDERRPNQPLSLHVSSSRPSKSSAEMEKERLAKLVAQEDDGYAEAYPASFEGVGFAALDEEEDEEAGLRNIDTRQNLKRHEFESDEAWAAYESQKEAIPKAAFQFGIKKEDGRQKKAFTEQKLKKQLRAVEDMIEEKQGKKIGGFEDVEEPKGRKQRDWPSERGGGKPRAPVVDVNSYENRLAQKRKERDGTGGHDEGTPKKPRLELPY